MNLNETPQLFQFETASQTGMKFMPMIVRFHLDLLGLHLSFAQWQALPEGDREKLACFPIIENAQPAPEFGRALQAMLHAHTNANTNANDEVQRFAPDASPAWQNLAAVPDDVIHQARLAGVHAPGVAQWARLTALQRYALCKLSRKPQVHRDFTAAMREFGL